MPPGILVNIDVDDLERATVFYCGLLEMRIGRRLGPDIVELVGGVAPFYLIANPSGTMVSPATDERRRYVRHWTPVHLDFVVDDLDAALAVAMTSGARLDDPPATHAWGRIAHLADPFGHGFCLIQFLGRGYDEIATD